MIYCLTARLLISGHQMAPHYSKAPLISRTKVLSKLHLVYFPSEENESRPFSQYPINYFSIKNIINEKGENLVC